METATILALLGMAYFAFRDRFTSGGDDQGDELADEPSTDTPKPALKTTFRPTAPKPTSPSGIGTGGGSALGNPPNPSGDPLGYNSALYKSHEDVRRHLSNLSYLPPSAVNNTPPPAAVVGKFQRDWNTASEEGFGDATGHLLEDEIPGKFTLRALEIANNGTDGHQVGDDLVRRVNWAMRFNFNG